MLFLTLPYFELVQFSVESFQKRKIIFGHLSLEKLSFTQDKSAHLISSLPLRFFISSFYWLKRKKLNHPTLDSKHLTGFTYQIFYLD